MINIKRLMYRNMEDTWLKFERGTTVLVFKSDEMNKLQHPQKIISIDSNISRQCRSDLNKIKNQQLKI